LAIQKNRINLANDRRLPLCVPAIGEGSVKLKTISIFLLTFTIAACATEPKVPYSTDFDPIAEMPSSNGEIRDDRTRFREIFCAVLEDHGHELEDYKPCEEALTRVGTEPPATGRPVDFGPSNGNYLVGIVPGLGWECIRGWLKFDNYGPNHVARFGYDAILIEVDGLSSTANNARQIRDTILEIPAEKSDKNLILIGYSKGAPDLLDFVVSYPEVAERVAAVVAMAGAVGGSPLAVDSTQDQANLLSKVPRSKCDEGDGGAMQDLHPDIRRQWLEENPLPEHIRYYSVVTFPSPDRVSIGLKSSWKDLGKVDARNDSQVIFYDQVIPHSTLVAFPNADHWAMAVPVARQHTFASSTFVNKNDYPREAFLEATLRYVEEDLAE
jgi:pimeloyl-ACP methyl ester carboxylesterase